MNTVLKSAKPDVIKVCKQSTTINEPEEKEHNTLVLGSALAHEKCIFTITLNSEKTPLRVFYTLVCPDTNHSLCHYLVSIDNNTFKIAVENNSECVRELSLMYLALF